jgi:hypothetical protein
MSEIRSYITISGHALDEYTFDPLEERPDIPDELRIEDIPNEPAYYIRAAAAEPAEPHG